MQKFPNFYIKALLHVQWENKVTMFQDLYKDQKNWQLQNDPKP